MALGSGLATLAQGVRQPPIELDMPVPGILIVAPPPLQEPKGPLAPTFAGASVKSVGLSDAYTAIAKELGCPAPWTVSTWMRTNMLVAV